MCVHHLHSDFLMIKLVRNIRSALSVTQKKPKIVPTICILNIVTFNNTIK